MRRPYVIGNWKMHGISTALPTISRIATAAQRLPHVDVALCLPATLIHRAVTAVPTLPIGGEDCHAEPDGAHTGSVAAAMLGDAGASLVILGHSERRVEGDGDAVIARKVAAAYSAGLDVVLCVGEQERDADAVRTVRAQLRRSLPRDFHDRLTIAYEPVWAIGKGILPDPSDVLAMANALREELGDTRILYGGSVTAATSAAMIEDGGVDGLLVGKASLSADSFIAIIQAVGDCALPAA